MAKPNILQTGKSYTFRSYFEMIYEPEDILAEFGVSLRRDTLTLPKADLESNAIPIANLKQNLRRRLPFVSLTSEAARREILIAPVVLELIDYTQAQLRIEYSINVSEQLKGSLDYYLRSENRLLIIEAKNADLARGLTQLAVELIALDRWIDEGENPLYGAVSTGDIWQFSRFDRRQKQIEQDLNLYRVPADLEDLFSILIGILLKSELY
ncbi:hypothetical protein [Lyngbya sp. CCY1209]|uniref:hypothetical protein n=1 Tax=Lyngbya sp. CCY1209 TaxID=2886103 RepID=UPI002D20AAAB|nr:hypothetical protein [Lyngbya sp. CCY1209]MEB3884816.1 hypothetical protein [Lyngbya sp. CCY1209]